jgi:hypothetical protein
MSVIPALWRLRQENCEFKGSAGYIVSPWSQGKKNTKNFKI